MSDHMAKDGVRRRIFSEIGCNAVALPITLIFRSHPAKGFDDYGR
jgi:hypothetical protein